MHTIRSRLTAGLLAKAERGELALMLPVGLVRDASGVVTKTPDLEVQARIALVFDTFLKRRTAVRVVRRCTSAASACRGGTAMDRPAGSARPFPQ